MSKIEKDCFVGKVSPPRNDPVKIPHHIGIIMDGNRRWAKEKELPAFAGHEAGAEKLKEISRHSFKKGVKILTAYCFSTENWGREKREVNLLMDLAFKFLGSDNIKEFNQNGIRVKIIGQKSRLSKKLQKNIQIIEDSTKNNQKGLLNLAISYGGRSEIINAIKNIMRLNMSENDITEEIIGKNLETADSPDPDLIIRSGGERRLSNFLTWQSAYSELYFSPKYWPDITTSDIDDAFLDYSRRIKKFGR